MSDDEIEKAVKEAAQYEAEDKKRKEAVDAKNDADSFVFQTEKAIEEVGDKLDPSDKANVETELNNLESKLKVENNIAVPSGSYSFPSQDTKKKR